MTHTRYVFLEQLQAIEEVSTVCLDASNHVHGSVQRVSLQHYAAIEPKAEYTIAVLPTTMVAIHRVEFPWLGVKKMRAALPYALEDAVVQPIQELFFAFDPHYYQDNQCSLLVIDKRILMTLMEHLKINHIHCDAITVDWCALECNEGLQLSRYGLVRSAVFDGAITADLREIYQQFDVNNATQPVNWLACGAEPWITIAQRLQKKHYINLLQGAFQQRSYKKQQLFWYYCGTVFLGLSLCVILIFNGIKLFILNHNIEQLNQQVETVYRVFFPNASRVISPRFRVQQWFKVNGPSTNEHLWRLLRDVSTSFDLKKMTPIKMRYQDNRLEITLFARDFSILEQFQQQLQQMHLHVRQVKAFMQDSKVFAILEIK